MQSECVLFVTIGCFLGGLLAIGTRRIKERSQKQEVTAFSYVHEKERNFSVSSLIEELLQSVEPESQDEINSVDLILTLFQRETFTSLNSEQKRMAKRSLLTLAKEKGKCLSIIDVIKVWQDNLELNMFADAIRDRFYRRMS